MDGDLAAGGPFPVAVQHDDAESFDITVAIPARNEVATIEPALAAIEVAASGLGLPVCVVVLANDCIDGTADAVRAFARASRLPVWVLECVLPAVRSDAGRARRLAMSAADGLTRAGGVVVTTDADAALMPDSLLAMLHGFRSGADLVCGQISTTLPAELLFAPSIQRIDLVTRRYAPLVREVRCSIDRLYGVQPDDGPVPHYTESGACMAISARMLRRIDGVPDIARGEDRALVRRAERAGARVLYCDRANAVVSPRLDGRAAGGMAETIRMRLADPDPIADESLLSCAAMHEEWRHAVRRHGLGPRPSLHEAEPRLRASDLERDLALMRAFVAEVVRPELAAIKRAGALACTA